MASIIGHGLFHDFNCEIQLEEPQPLGKILNRLAIPEHLREVMLVVRDCRTIRSGDLITDKDEIHLFMTIAGG